MSYHHGKFMGRCEPHHGHSRQAHSFILTAAGGEVYCAEAIDLQPGTRVSFNFHAGATGEQMAIDVKPIDPPSATTPAGPVKATPQKKGK
jgi:hypothetical protein